MPEKLLVQLLRLPVGRVKPPVENGSSILHPKITQHRSIFPNFLGVRHDSACERDVRIDTNRANGISFSAKILVAMRKFDGGRRLNASRDGGRI